MRTLSSTSFMTVVNVPLVHASYTLLMVEYTSRTSILVRRGWVVTKIPIFEIIIARFLWNVLIILRGSSLSISSRVPVTTNALKRVSTWEGNGRVQSV